MGDEHKACLGCTCMQLCACELYVVLVHMHVYVCVIDGAWTGILTHHQRPSGPLC